MYVKELPWIETSGGELSETSLPTPILGKAVKRVVIVMYNCPIQIAHYCPGHDVKLHPPCFLRKRVSCQDHAP